MGRYTNLSIFHLLAERLKDSRLRCDCEPEFFASAHLGNTFRVAGASHSSTWKRGCGEASNALSVSGRLASFCRVEVQLAESFKQASPQSYMYAQCYAVCPSVLEYRDSKHGQPQRPHFVLLSKAVYNNGLVNAALYA